MVIFWQFGDKTSSGYLLLWKIMNYLKIYGFLSGILRESGFYKTGKSLQACEENLTVQVYAKDFWIEPNMLILHTHIDKGPQHFSGVTRLLQSDLHLNY